MFKIAAILQCVRAITGRGSMQFDAHVLTQKHNLRQQLSCIDFSDAAAAWRWQWWWWWLRGMWRTVGVDDNECGGGAKISHLYILGFWYYVFIKGGPQFKKPPDKSSNPSKGKNTKKRKSRDNKGSQFRLIKKVSHKITELLVEMFIQISLWS